MGMEFLYFPEDKSEYLPGIISVIVIILLSALIFRLLMKASKKEVENLEKQGFSASSQYQVGGSTAEYKKVADERESEDKVSQSADDGTPPEK